MLSRILNLLDDSENVSEDDFTRKLICFKSATFSKENSKNRSIDENEELYEKSFLNN